MDFSAVAASVLEELRDPQPDRRVQVRIEPAIVVDADPELLAVIVANLLGNAWKFTSRLETAHLSVGRTFQEDEQVLYVRDDGIGVDEAGHLFGAFQRYHQAEDFPGDGIGLATVQRLVARHGGRVWAESEPGQGATFFFTLPRPQ